MDLNELLVEATKKAADVVVICKNEDNYPIIFVNEAFTKMTGYTAEEAIGKNPGRLLQGEYTSEETKSKIRKALQSKEIIREDVLNYSKDGNPYWVELHIFPCSGHFISIQRDITERKQMENELEEYKEFFDEAPVALFRTDLKTGQFLMANKYAAEMLGFDSIEELLTNLKSTELYPLEDRQKLIQKMKRHGEVKDYEIKLRVGKEQKWVSANMHINCGGDCIEGSLVDITPLVEMRDKNLKMLQRVGEQIEKRITALAG